MLSLKVPGELSSFFEVINSGTIIEYFNKQQLHRFSNVQNCKSALDTVFSTQFCFSNIRDSLYQ
jgi:hypothetical protein